MNEHLSRSSDRGLSILSRTILAILLIGLATDPAGAETTVRVLPLRERAALRDSWLAKRLGELVPMLMRREGIDMWILAAREYNEDPVVETMLPSTWFSARRRTILVFFTPLGEGSPERITISRYSMGDFFKASWDQEKQPDQWARLAEVVQQRNPRRIALNRSSDFALADGLTHSEFEALCAALPASFVERIVSGQSLAVGWLETRIEEEMQVYPSICRLAHQIIAEGLSESAVVPGVTSTEDLEWWYRERIEQAQVHTWFHPSVSVQRASEEDRRSFAEPAAETVILPGDLIHVDFGISYLGLNTDTQQHAYVLLPGEHEAPAGLRHALAAANGLQDILFSQFVAGRTGNEILRSALAESERQQIKASIYSHPLGFHGHAAGPTIGLWDQQDGVPGQGDYPLFPRTVYSIELNAASPVPEWNGQEVRIMFEEDAYFDGENLRYIDGRQTRLWLIPRQLEGGG